MLLNNFFRFHQSQEINFIASGEKNVTVIRGENGSGKTTLLNAFYWCFYGDVTEPLTIDNMLNYMTVAKMNDGDKTEASVEIEFEDKNVKYSMIRRQRFMKKNSTIVKIGEPELLVSYTNEKGNEDKVDYPEVFFTNIIPSQLRGFFFFDGERINRLAQIDGKYEIRKAILDLLGLTNLETVKKDFDEVNNDFAKEIKKYMKVDEISLSDDLTSKNEFLTKLKDQLSVKKDESSKAKDNSKRVNEFLLQNNSDLVRKKQSDRMILESDIKKLDKRLEDNRNGLLQFVSKNFKSCLITQITPNVSQMLEDKRKKGELPSDIKLQFIDDLLERKRCICGCGLHEGTKEYENVHNMKKIAGRTELDDAYTRLTSYIKYIEPEKGKFYSNYHQYCKDDLDIRADKEIKEKRLKAISDELKNSPEQKIKEYENLRDGFQEQISTLDREMGKLGFQISEIENDIAKLKSKLNEANLASSQAQEIQKCMRLLENLGQLNNEIQNFFIKSTRENLDQKIKDVFGLLSRKGYRVPVLTEDFELKIISTIKNNNNAEVLSTGEGQITSLSFIGSLVSYSREKAGSELLSNFSGGDFPIVMDSPFGYLDETHSSNVAAGIGDLASQVIIIVSDKQWSKDVEDNIYDRVGKMYKMIDGDFLKENSGEYTVLDEVVL